LCECKTQYKSLIRKQKRRYELMKLDTLEQLRHCKPRAFGSYLNIIPMQIRLTQFP